jgi:RNA polymerase sigma-70 factor (ECF subfamily)
VSVPDSTASRFLSLLPAERRPACAAAPGELADALGALLQAGREAWPRLPLPEDTLLAFLAQRVAAQEDPLQALRSLHAVDLYLVCAFLHRVDGAAAALEKTYFSSITSILRRQGVSEPVAEDVRQSIYVQMLSHQEPGGSGLRQYQGRGSLKSWLRVAATRMARRIQDRGRRERPLAADTPAGFLLAGADPQLEQMQRPFQAEFKASLQEALEGLSAPERNLLRFYFVDGLNIDEIGVIQRVHRATVARRINALRSRLLIDVRSALVRRLRLAQPDLDSLIRLVDSQLELSLHRLLSPG